jgi:ubiquitin-conjugating enzyme E2 J1
MSTGQDAEDKDGQRRRCDGEEELDEGDVNSARSSRGNEYGRELRREEVVTEDDCEKDFDDDSNDNEISAKINTNKYRTNSSAVRRISQEMKEFVKDERSIEKSTDAFAAWAEPLEDDIFEWHFAIYGAEGTAFEGGIYHGRILLPVDYPFKPPNFMLLTNNGRFETMTKICLSITSYHAEHWQPSWSVRTALHAIRAFMVTPSEGALGGIDFSEEQRRDLAVKSRQEKVNFTFGSEQRQMVTKAVHAKMLQRMPIAKLAAKKMAEQLKKEKDRSHNEQQQQQQGELERNIHGSTEETRTTTIGGGNVTVAEETEQHTGQHPLPTTTVTRTQVPSAVVAARVTQTPPQPSPTTSDRQQQQQQQRPIAPIAPRVNNNNNNNNNNDDDDRTVPMKILDSLSICIVVAIVAILLKRAMFVPL